MGYTGRCILRYLFDDRGRAGLGRILRYQRYQDDQSRIEKHRHCYNKTRNTQSVSILLGALSIGLIAGMPFDDIILAVNDGIGNTLKGIALLVGLVIYTSDVLRFMFSFYNFSEIMSTHQMYFDFFLYRIWQLKQLHWILPDW